MLGFAMGLRQALSDRLALRVDPLTLRLALGVVLIVVGPLLASFYLLTRHFHDSAVDARRRSAANENRVLEIALRHQMIERDSRLLTSVLDEIGRQPDVRRAMILDHEGEIRLASDPQLVGTHVGRESPTCVVCHSMSPAERSDWVLLENEEENLLRSVLPIENRQECHACHAPEARLNGILIMDVSLAELEAQTRREIAWVVAGTAALAVALLGGIGLLVRRFILVRLGRLGRTARSIAAGHLEERAAVEGDDVITLLARDFNNMASATAHLVAELRRQESQLAGVLNSLEDGLVVLDREGRVLASNRSFARRAGSHPEALRGHACREQVDAALPCCSSTEACPARRCLTTSQLQRATYRSLGEGGETRRVEEVYASPVFGPDGEVIQVVELWRDITERVQEEERLAELERMVSLGALASGLSHEVNNPLATMLTCAEAVGRRLEELDGAPASPELLDSIRTHALTIRDQVLRCRRITEQFRRFSRGIPPTSEPLDIAPLVQGVVALVRPTAREARVELALEQHGPLPPVRANAEAVQHVVLNLLLNAVQSCEERGGVVRVRLCADPAVRIEVEDSGVGIAPQDRAHLFEPFRSRKRQGTGLGLFLSRSFMRRFGGDVLLLHSEVGAGSTFQVVFAGQEEPVR